MHDRCFVDGVEYNQTVIRLRACASIWTTQDGQKVPGIISTEADLQTANPTLIAQLFESCFNAKRVNVRIEGRIKAEASNAMIVENCRYYSDGEMASFELRCGEPIRFEAVK